MYLGYDGVINVSCKFFPRLSRSFVGWIGPRSGTFGHPFYHPEDLSWCYDVIMKPVMKAFVGHWYQDISKIFKDHWELPPYYHRHDWLAVSEWTITAVSCHAAMPRAAVASQAGAVIRGRSAPVIRCRSFSVVSRTMPFDLYILQTRQKEGDPNPKMIYHLVMTNTSPWYRWPIYRWFTY